MSISYGELSNIQSLASEDLKRMAHAIENIQKRDEDDEDTLNAVLSEMESRELERP